MSQTANAIPVQAKERIQIVDVLRGFAIFGILLFNMRSFAGQSININDWTEPLDRAIVILIDFFVQAKFYSLFSFFFGWGMAVQMRRAEIKGTKFFPVYLRRLLILLVFGTLHGVLLWTGDILRMYAVIDIFMLIIFHKQKPNTILIAAVLLLLSAIQMTLPGEMMDKTRELCFSLTECLTPNTSLPGTLYATGTYWQVTQLRYQEFIGSLWWLPCYMGNVFAMMLLGLYAGKRKLFANFEKHRSLFRKFMWGGLVIGLIFNGIFTYYTVNPFNSQYYSLVRIGARTLGAPALTIFYITGITLLFQNLKWRERLAPLAYVGRMALTNYITHSVILTFFFYGYGLGLYGKTDPTFALLLTIVVYLAQIRFSQWWFEHYQFGPLEWGWRALTYARRHPFSAKDTYESIQRNPKEIQRRRMRLLGVIWAFFLLWGFGLYRWSVSLSTEKEVSPLELALRGEDVPEAIFAIEEDDVAEEYEITPPITQPVNISPGPAAAIGDQTAIANAFDAERALSHIEELTQPKYAGRAAGSEGGQLAAEYIAAQFERYGLQPAGVDGSFYQEFPVDYTELTDLPTLTITNSAGTHQYTLHEDFTPLIGAYLGAGTGSGDVVWVNDCSNTAFIGLDVVGKIVFCESDDIDASGRNAAENGAAGLLILTDPDEIPPQAGSAFLPVWIPQPIPAFRVYPNVAEDLLSGSGVTLADLTLIFEPFELSTKATLAIITNSPCGINCTAQNVLGVLTGSDPAYAKQVIIVGASYDSLGTYPNDVIWQNADKSLTGVASLLEIARSWREQGYAPRVTTLFVAWDAGEQASAGAAYYAAHPQYPSENLLATIELGASNTLFHLPEDTAENISLDDLEETGKSASLTLLGLAEGPAEIEGLLTRRSQAVTEGDLAAFLATSALSEHETDKDWFEDAQALKPLSCEMTFSDLQMVGDNAATTVKITLEAAGESGGSRNVTLSMPIQFRYASETWLWAGADLEQFAPSEEDETPRFSVYYPAGREEGFEGLGEAAATEYTEIATLLGLPINNNARILLFDGNEALRASSAMSLGRNENMSISPNTIKLAYSAEIVGGERFNDAIAHLVLADAGIPKGAAPWLWEGLPLLIEAEKDPLGAQGRLISPLLNSVSLDGAPQRAETSWAAVDYLRERLGWAGLGNFISAFGRACQSNNCNTEEGADAALATALRMDTETFHRAWRQTWATRLEHVQTSLDALLTTRIYAVLNGDLNAFLATVDRRTPNLIREETDWFANLSEYPIESFGLSAKPVAILADGSVHASVTLSYQLEGVSASWGGSSSTFRVLFKESGNSYRWAGFPLNNISGSHLRVRYPAGQEALAAELLANAEDIYTTVAVDMNSSPTWQTINLYSDENAYRTSIFLSYPNNDWTPGWSAQGQSLKFFLEPNATPESYRALLAVHFARLLLLQNGVQDEWLLAGGSNYLARGVDGGASQMAAAANLYSLGKAIETESLFDFAAFPAIYRMSEAEYKIASPQAWNAIRYLAETYGQDALWRVLRANDVEAALRAATGRTLPEFAADWQASFATGHSTNNWVAIAEGFDEERALAHIEYLTSPELAGRQAGSPGAVLAADYIAEKFAEYGLDVQRQTFSVPYLYYLKTPQLNLTIQTDGSQETFIYREDFLILQAAKTSGMLNGELVWIMDEDYANMQLDGNIVVRRATKSIEEEIAAATEHGASALLLVGDRNRDEDLRAKYLIRDLPTEDMIPVFELTREGFKRLLEMSGESPASIYATPPAHFLGIDAQLNIDLNEEQNADSANIFGFLPGSNPSLAGEIIIVGAHYDHVGDDPERRYSGANDNASGVAAILEIAQLWQETGYRPQRSILFVAWGAQELGEMGSRYYVGNPIYPLGDVTAMIQLDSIANGEAYHLDAQGSRENEGQLLYSIEHAKDLLGGRLQLSFPEARGEQPFSPDVLFDRDRISINSDHDPFRETGIQAMRIAWREADETNLDDELAFEIDPARFAAAGKMSVLTIMLNAR